MTTTDPEPRPAEAAPATERQRAAAALGTTPEALSRALVAAWLAALDETLAGAAPADHAESEAAA